MANARSSTSRSVCAVAASLIASGLSPTAHADSEPGQYVDVVARAAILQATAVEGSHTGRLIGLGVDYRLGPAWRVGGYADFVGVKSLSSDESCAGGPCPHYSFGVFRFGPRGEWHVQPEEVDPWLAASVGAFNHSVVPNYIAGHSDRYESEWGADAELDVGIDFHIGRFFSFGPCLLVIIPFFNPNAAVDVGSSGRPIGVLVPMLEGFIPGIPPGPADCVNNLMATRRPVVPEPGLL